MEKQHTRDVLPSIYGLAIACLTDALAQLFHPLDAPEQFDARRHQPFVDGSHDEVIRATRETGDLLARRNALTHEHDGHFGGVGHRPQRATKIKGVALARVDIRHDKIDAVALGNALGLGTTGQCQHVHALAETLIEG